MNTSKRKQKAIRLGIAAVLALVLLVSVSVVLVIADEPDEVQADAMKVTLDGKVNLIFKYKDETVKSGTVSYTAVIGKGGRETDLEFEKVDGKHVVTVPLMPYEMTETVSLYHVDKDGNYLAVSTGSVRAYADEVLASPKHAAHHNKIRALLNYGAMTQIDANANTSNLANADVFVRNNPIDIIKAVPFKTLDKTDGNQTLKEKTSVNLVFKGGDIVLRYTVKGVDSAPTATFTYNNENHSGTFVPQEDGSYTFDISNVGVNNFDTVWDVTITSGKKTVTSHHSVLEYLNYLVTSTVTSTGEKITAEEKDVARSLYQLYQNTRNKLETECNHLNPGYYIPAGENSSYLMCAACGNKIQETAIDNKITAYFSGEHLSGIKAYGDVDATYSEGNGYQIAWKTAGSALELIWLREAYYTSESLKQADGQWGDVPFDIGNAKYLVIRYKVNAGSGITGIYAYLGSTEWTAEDTTGAEGQSSVYSYQKTTLKDGDADCTAILYLDDFGDKVAADENGNRVIDGLKLGIAGTAKESDTLTIESIEFFTGEIQHGNMKTTMTDGVPSTVCTVCNRPVLPENTFIDGNFLVALDGKGANTAYTATASVGNENGNSYYHLTSTTTTGQHIWFREPYNGKTIGSNMTLSATGKVNASHNVPGFTTVTDDKMTLTTSGAVVLYRDYPALNVGTARYLVIRARTNFTAAKPFFLYMGTVGFRNPESNGGGQCASVRFNTANDGKWMTYVLDLENQGLKDRAPTVKDANDNDIRIFDSFWLTTVMDGGMDIDYIAFVNKLSDVADITEDDSVRIINDISTGASTLTDKADLKN